MKKISIVRTAQVIALVFLLGGAFSSAFAKWKVNIEPNPRGGFIALIENLDREGNAIETRTVGRYKTKREARKAAREAADDANEPSP
ncbi:MAG: hypothetical protein GXP09_09630 [Gammaproteobacteria bacterium]|nr:hypothetical protein [Gammaproteobacteria bacterium]